jgi:polyisoprenoid-binding protein YceI
VVIRATHGFRKHLRWVSGIAFGLALLVFGVPYVYVRFFETKPPIPLSFDDLSDESQVRPGDPARPPVLHWTAVQPSSASYVAFSERKRISGSTGIVSGSASLTTESTVEKVTIQVDLATVGGDDSDQDQRFRSNATGSGKFPVASLNFGPGPISFDRTTSAEFTGTVSIRGIERTTLFRIQSRRVRRHVELSGSFDLTWSAWNISDPFSRLSSTEQPRLEFSVTFVPTPSEQVSPNSS